MRIKLMPVAKIQLLSETSKQMVIYLSESAETVSPRDHQEELLPTYNGKYVMIVGNKVVGACNTISEAYYKGKKEFGLGKFLVQLCTPGDSAYTITYHTQYR